MSDWYKYGDKLYRSIVIEVERIFRKARLTVNFDELNVLSSRTLATRVYTQLIAINRKRYFDLVDFLWEQAILEALSFLTSDSESAVSSSAPLPEEYRLSTFEVEQMMQDFLTSYNPVTKYVYEQEVERKRARFFESIAADASVKDRRAWEEDFRRAEHLWDQQTGQNMIDLEDYVRKEAYKRAGVERVKWITQDDDRVCTECDSLDGKVFPIDKVPPKPHPRCRCYIVPTRRTVSIMNEDTDDIE